MKAKGRVLIVDDNEDLCRNLLDILELKGYEVVGVYDGYQAIEAIKNDKFNVVLLDIKMPGMSGIETLKIIKQISSNTAVIMITAFADDVFYRDGLEGEKYEIIQKPIDIDAFLNLLEGIVNKENN